MLTQLGIYLKTPEVTNLWDSIGVPTESYYIDYCDSPSADPLGWHPRECARIHSPTIDSWLEGAEQA